MKTKHLATLALLIALLGAVMTLAAPGITADSWPAQPRLSLR